MRQVQLGTSEAYFTEPNLDIEFAMGRAVVSSASPAVSQKLLLGTIETQLMEPIVEMKLRIGAWENVPL
mgnify:CR=1 FL=1